MWSYPTTTGGSEVYNIEEVVTRDLALKASKDMGMEVPMSLQPGMDTPAGIEAHLRKEAIKALKKRYGGYGKFPDDVVDDYQHEIQRKRSMEEWIEHFSGISSQYNSSRGGQLRIFVLKKPGGKVSVVFSIINDDKLGQMKGRHDQTVHTKYRSAIRQWAIDNSMDFEKMDRINESLNRLKQLSGI